MERKSARSGSTDTSRRVARSKRPVRWQLPALVALLTASVVLPAHAIKVNVSALDVERALDISRGRDAERAQFHAPYIKTFDDPFVERVEIVTEFRRIVLLCEEHIKKGDRGFAYSSRIAAEAVRPWNRRVSIVARLRFHPQNNYVDVPPVEVTLDGPNADTALIGVSKDPVLGFTSADKPTAAAPILGAVVEGVFDAALIGQTERSVTIKLAGKQLLTTRLNFAGVE